jgi:hypothetical protein
MGGPQLEFTYMCGPYWNRGETYKMVFLPPSSFDFGIIICERHIYKSLQINLGHDNSFHIYGFHKEQK